MTLENVACAYSTGESRVETGKLVVIPPEDTTRDRLNPRANAYGLGYSFVLALVSSVGVLLVVLAYNDGRAEQETAVLQRWIGLMLVYAPIAFRLISQGASRQERIALVLILTCCFYLVKFLYSPLEFRFTDEFQHWRGVVEILENHRLFMPNHILPVAQLYPGLHTIISAVVTIGNTGIFEAGHLVIWLSRLVLALSLFLFYEQASGSAWVAGIASLLYMTNPHYLFFTAMFSYQTLALSLAAVTLLAVSRLAAFQGWGRWKYVIIAIMGFFALVVTHHLTSYAILSLLLVWSFSSMINRRGTPISSRVIIFTAASLWLIIIWTLASGSTTIDYLKGPISGAVFELIKLVTGETSIGGTFNAPTGPFYEQWIAALSVLCIVGGIIPGVLCMWRRYFRDPLPMGLALVALGYFVSIGVRFTSQGGELTARLWSFVLPVTSFVIAVLFVAITRRYGQRLIKVGLLLVSMVLFAGGIVNGWPPYWDRFPGPYLVGGMERSVDPEGVQTANWVLKNLGPRNRITADFTSYHLLGAYGLQNPEFGLAEVYRAPTMDDYEWGLLLEAFTRYILVDQRFSQSLPISGAYYGPNERGFVYTQPVAQESLAKFDTIESIDRIYDSGDIVIYDAGRVLTGGR
jgi:hypothetical protein